MRALRGCPVLRCTLSPLDLALPHNAFSAMPFGSTTLKPHGEMTLDQTIGDTDTDKSFLGQGLSLCIIY